MPAATKLNTHQQPSASTGRQLYACTKCGLRLEGRMAPCTGLIHAYDARGSSPGPAQPAICAECLERGT